MTGPGGEQCPVCGYAYDGKHPIGTVYYPTGDEEQYCPADDNYMYIHETAH